jgi:uncharacterized alkaline shock family protein YloU
MSDTKKTDAKGAATDSKQIDLPDDDAAKKPVAPSDEVDAEELTDGGGHGIVSYDDDDDLEGEDSLTFSNGVIEKIVALAVRDVPGVLGMRGSFFNRVQETFGASNPAKGVSVEVMPDNSVKVNISVLIEYGTYAPQVFEDVKRAVVKQVAGMTGLEVKGVNLRIEDVLTADEFKGAERAEREEAAAAAAAAAGDSSADADEDQTAEDAE